MPAIKQISWRSMAQAHPAAHVVIAKLSEGDATNMRRGSGCTAIWQGHFAAMSTRLPSLTAWSATGSTALARSTAAAKLAKAVRADDMDGQPEALF
jgi:hypothetical protein